jgi:hypothetical protein
VSKSLCANAVPQTTLKRKIERDFFIGDVKLFLNIAKAAVLLLLLCIKWKFFYAEGDAQEAG